MYSAERVQGSMFSAFDLLSEKAKIKTQEGASKCGCSDLPMTAKGSSSWSKGFPAPCPCLEVLTAPEDQTPPINIS